MRAHVPALLAHLQPDATGIDEGGAERLRKRKAEAVAERLPVGRNRVPAVDREKPSAAVATKVADRDPLRRAHHGTVRPLGESPDFGEHEGRGSG